MFTGIIQEQGKVLEIKTRAGLKQFKISHQNSLKNKKIGESISVNGACLTITQLEKKHFICQAIPETLKKTNLGLVKLGDMVNLEPALTLNQSIDGHLIQGHVDTTAKVVKLEKDGTLTVQIPQELKQHFALKGSVTINGVSLTISSLSPKNFAVSLIPHTLKSTNLQNLKQNDLVNIEIDLISRYLENLLKNR